MPYIVYILECNDKTYYTGCTNNLVRRLTAHNSNKDGAHYTKLRRPVVLKYKEQFSTLLLARRREAQIKRWRKEKKKQLIDLIPLT